jgi:hypothetical protein
VLTVVHREKSKHVKYQLIVERENVKSVLTVVHRGKSKHVKYQLIVERENVKKCADCCTSRKK